MAWTNVEWVLGTALMTFGICVGIFAGAIGITAAFGPPRRRTQQGCSSRRQRRSLGGCRRILLLLGVLGPPTCQRSRKLPLTSEGQSEDEGKKFPAVIIDASFPCLPRDTGSPVRCRPECKTNAVSPEVVPDAARCACLAGSGYSWHPPRGCANGPSLSSTCPHPHSAAPPGRRPGSTPWPRRSPARPAPAPASWSAWAASRRRPGKSPASSAPSRRPSAGARARPAAAIRR